MDGSSANDVDESGKPPYEKFEESISDQNAASKSRISGNGSPWKNVFFANLFCSVIIAVLTTLAASLLLKSEWRKDIEDLQRSLEKNITDIHSRLRDVSVLEDAIKTTDLDIRGIKVRILSLEQTVLVLDGKINATGEKMDNFESRISSNTDKLTQLDNITQCFLGREARMTHNNYIAYVSEDAKVETTILRVAAVYGSVTESERLIMYAMNADVPFKIHTMSGIISTTGTLDRETTSSYMFEVSLVGTCSTDQQSIRSSVIVNINDVNDNAPIFSNEVYRGIVNFGAALNTSVLQVNATDNDAGANGIISYSIVSEFRQFNISKTSGEIVLARKITEEVTSFGFHVIARDATIIDCNRVEFRCDWSCSCNGLQRSTCTLKMCYKWIASLGGDIFGRNHRSNVNQFSGLIVTLEEVAFAYFAIVISVYLKEN